MGNKNTTTTINSSGMDEVCINELSVFPNENKNGPYKNEKQRFKINPFKHSSKRMNKHEQFFIKYCHDRNIKTQTQSKHDIDSLDPRRVVFVSLFGLYRTWQDVPTYILYSCLIILPLHRNWLKSDGPKESQSQFDPATLLDKSQPEIQQFMEFLRFKDYQGLVFWAKDYELRSENSLISPFWLNFNNRLKQMYCPIKQKYCSSLKDASFYENDYRSKYNVNQKDILLEYHYRILKYKPMMEIIYQSNPDSLNPMYSYNPENVTLKYTKKSTSNLVNIVDGVDGDLHQNLDLEVGEFSTIIPTLKDFWISEDYDPYDLSDQDNNFSDNDDINDDEIKNE